MILDLSEWQGTIDFSQIASNRDIEGVILRVQAGYTHPDTKYKEYVQGCKQYGIKFASYAYLKPVSVNDAVAEANNYINLVDKDSIAHFADIEEKTCSDLVGAGQAFLDTLEKAGLKKLGLYSGEYFFNDNNLNNIKRELTWIANYSKRPSVPCDLWQYRSDGKVNGINTNVDCSLATCKNPFVYHFPVMRVLCETDVRSEPDHKSAFIKNAHAGEEYNQIGYFQGWAKVILDDKNQGWIDGNNGQNLYWVNNPALKG